MKIVCLLFASLTLAAPAHAQEVVALAIDGWRQC